MSTFKIIFVGSNPSAASKTILPFYGDTKSDIVIRDWMEKLNLDHSKFSVRYCNVADIHTKNNKPLSLKDIRAHLPNLASKLHGHHIIVALGKTSVKALTLLQADFFEMPHPSPLNRLNNDSKFVENKLKELKEYILNTKMPQFNI